MNLKISGRTGLGLICIWALLMCAAASAQSLNSQSTAQSAAQTTAQAASEPLGLRAAAQTGFKTMVKELSANMDAGTLLQDFGFAVQRLSDLQRAELGIAFEVHTVHPQTLLAGGKAFDQMLMKTGIWNFIVKVDGRPVALLEMEKAGGKWIILGAGAANLAQDIHTASSAHAGGKAFRFVRVYQATADFMEVRDSQAQARYVPLIAARQTLNMASPFGTDTALASGDDILPNLQNQVRSHLAHFNK